MTSGLPNDDTIVALASPPGRGGVAVIRVSGDTASAVAKAIVGDLPEPRRASLRCFRDQAGEAIDSGLVLYFPGPSSFTGEDVVEFHAHGGSMVTDLLLQQCAQLGARLARPGEFSQRAFLNDRLDLAQAEAIADLIDSGSAQAARAAVRSLQGEFSTQVNDLVRGLTALRVYVEAAIDFPEEEVDFLADQGILDRLKELRAGFENLAVRAGQGAILRQGMSVVLAGRPNAGKSSLMNRLTGEDTAIVTAQPGTTRDVLREQISIDGMPLHVVDTAGLRAAGDSAEIEGIRRARSAMEQADQVLLVIDASDAPDGVDGMSREALSQLLPEGMLSELPDPSVLTIVRNKIDISGHAPGLEQRADVSVVNLSALTGAGIGALRDHLKLLMGYQAAGEGALSARRRHLDALAQARAHLEEAVHQLEQYRAGELVAEELRLAQDKLGLITGEVSSDDLLGQIFSSFCIGK
ncbi:MAG: tRNA uridine-5-carboxymethylaminomethyl(34) synthesis GTPase MnmE [Gammaproteobacteria bacterium]